MAETKVRYSNIELLRIVAIFLVMVAHCNIWLGGGLPDATDGMTVMFWGKHVIASLSSICDVLFVLISGYFTIKPNLKSVITLWTQIFIVYLYVFIIQTIATGGGINYKSLILCFLPFTVGNWFVKSYLILMLLSPALNLMTDKLSRKGMLLFLMLLSIIALLWGCIINDPAAGFNKGYSPLSFVYFYMVGRYLRLYSINDKSKWFYFGSYLLLSLVLFVGLFAKQMWMLYYCNPILVLSAASLFMFFVKWDIGHVGFVNWVASSVFAVFIFHTKEPVVGWLKSYNIQKLNTLPYFEYLCLMFVVLIAIFMVAILMDKIRGYIFKPIIIYVSRIEILSNNSEKLISIKKNESIFIPRTGDTEGGNG